jgi:thiamine-phosphate pyrophosphorylase
MASQGKPAGPRRAAPRLYLVTPQVAEPAGLTAALAATLAATDIAAVLLRLADADERTLLTRVKVLAPAVQERDAALVLDGRPELVARSGADGAHLTGIDDFKSALAALKPERIAGCGGLHTRHDAMLAAEAGADYVMFGEVEESGRRPAFQAVVERVAWWAEVFEAPCVAYAAALDEIEPLARAGAEFVALGDWVFAADARDTAAAVGEAARRLAIGEAAA